MWLIGRCERKRDTAESHDRRRLYEEGVTILFGPQSALTSEVEGDTHCKAMMKPLFLKEGKNF